MTFYLGNVAVYPGVLPTPSTTSIGSPLSNDGTNGFWNYPGESHTIAGTGWLYRTIITHGYLAGGYKGYNPWRSVNKTWHQTDTTIYCGEQMDKGAAYFDGTYSDYNAYCHGTSDTWAGVSTHTSSYNLANGNRRSALSQASSSFGSGSAPYGYMGHNPGADGLSYGSGPGSPAGTGGWEMNVGRAYHGCASTQINGAGYIYGGNTAVTNKMHFPSEIMYTTTSSPITWGTVASTGGQTLAYILGNSVASGCQYMSYSNDAYTTWGFNGGTADGNNKALMTKHGWFYSGVGGNTDSRIWKFNDNTTAYISAMTKLGNFGEENMQMGQNWGYMLGNFNGQQNNWTTKTTYSTDAMITMGPATQPKGHYGQSSGACSSAAASICSPQRT